LKTLSWNKHFNLNLFVSSGHFNLAKRGGSIGGCSEYCNYFQYSLNLVSFLFKLQRVVICLRFENSHQSSALHTAHFALLTLNNLDYSGAAVSLIGC
jgi:hypothetical protein